MVVLSNSELNVMEVLWSIGDESASNIAKILKDKIGWSRNTTYTIIKRCVEILWCAIIIKLLMPVRIPINMNILLDGINQLTSVADAGINQSDKLTNAQITDSEGKHLVSVYEEKDSNHILSVQSNVEHYHMDAHSNRGYSVVSIVWMLGLIACVLYFTISYYQSYKLIRGCISLKDKKIQLWMKREKMERVEILMSDEIACDEGVIEKYGELSKHEYAMTLIQFVEYNSKRRDMYFAFGSKLIKERVFSIMKFKKMTCVGIGCVALAGILSFTAFGQPISAGKKLNHVALSSQYNSSQGTEFSLIKVKMITAVM